MKHISVLLAESIDGLNIKSDGIYVDGTLGRAGHSREILKYLNQGKLYSFDKDQSAIDSIVDKQDNWILIKDDFKNLKNSLKQHNVKSIDGILLDIGVSSPQFDDKERGFSYRFDSRLDMRMDVTQKLDAHYIVNNYSIKELTEIFRNYGEEKFAYSIAKNIVNFRQSKIINTTFELVDIIKSSMPARELKKVGHPAKKVFQALRIEVNGELDALKKVIEDCASILNLNGRMVIITFHSLEDRIVKQMFNQLANQHKVDVNIPLMPDQIKKPEFQVLTRKPILPSESEIVSNKRSKSAKLRILERISYNEEK